MPGNRRCFFRRTTRGRASERGNGEAEGGWDASERKGGQSNSTLKPDRRDGGGWRKNAATVEAQGERWAFLRLIKDIRGRLARYFSPPSVNRGAQPPPSIIPQKVDEGIFVLWPPGDLPPLASQSPVTVLVVNCAVTVSLFLSVYRVSYSSALGNNQLEQQFGVTDTCTYKRLWERTK